MPRWKFRVLAPEPGGITYDFDEDFEGTGTPSGWSVSGSPDFDYVTSPAPLKDTESLYLPAGAIATGPTLSPERSTFWLDGYVDFGVTPSANSNIVIIRNSAASLLAGISYRTNGALRIVMNNGAQSSVDIFTPNVSNVHHFWIRYVKGTGSDAIMDLYIVDNTSTDTKPGSPTASIINGGSTTDANNIRLVGPTGSDIIFDNVRGSAETIP